MSSTNKLSGATNSGLLIIACSTTILTFHSFDEYIAPLGLAEWGGWLAFCGAGSVGVGFYLFWRWAFLTLPEMKAEMRGRCFTIMLTGMICIFGASTQTNFMTLFGGTAELLHQQQNTEQTKQTADDVQNAIHRIEAIEPALRAAQKELHFFQKQESCCGHLSSVRGPGGVTIMLNGMQQKVGDVADELPSIKQRAGSLVDEYIELSGDIAEAFEDKSEDQKARQTELSKLSDEQRSKLIELKGTLPLVALRGLDDMFFGEIVMPSLSSNPVTARKQRGALEQNLPATLKKIGGPIRAELEVIEKLAAEIEPPIFKYKTTAQLVWLHWRAGINVLAASIAIDFLPLALLGFACRLADNERGMDKDHNPFGGNPAGNITISEALQTARALDELQSEMHQMQIDAALRKEIRESVILNIDREQS